MAEDYTALVERLLIAYAGGLVAVPDESNPRGFAVLYQPVVAMSGALEATGIAALLAENARG
jgi:hypothetical protein